MLDKIKLIVYDFDGVMTNNTAIVDQNGQESVIVNRSDGLAISELKKLGYEQIIISTETNPVVQKRAEKLKIYCLNGIEDKLITLKEYLNTNRIDKNRVLYVGNDINDFEVMKYVGIPVSPLDAYSIVQDISKIVINKNGGDGVIRELYELIKTKNENVNQ